MENAHFAYDYSKIQIHANQLQKQWKTDGQTLVVFPTTDLNQWTHPPLKINEWEYVLSRLFVFNDKGNHYVVLEHKPRTTGSNVWIVVPLTTSSFTTTQNSCIHRLLHLENNQEINCRDLIPPSSSGSGFSATLYTQDHTVIVSSSPIIVNASDLKLLTPLSSFPHEIQSIFPAVSQGNSIFLRPTNTTNTPNPKQPPAVIMGGGGRSRSGSDAVVEGMTAEEWENVECEPIDIGADEITTMQVPYSSDVLGNASVVMAIQGSMGIFFTIVFLGVSALLVPPIYIFLLGNGVKDPRIKKKMSIIEMILFTCFTIAAVGLIADGLTKSKEKNPKKRKKERADVKIAVGFIMMLFLFVVFGIIQVLKAFYPDTYGFTFMGWGDLFSVGFSQLGADNVENLLVAFMFWSAAIIVMTCILLQVILKKMTFSWWFWMCDTFIVGFGLGTIMFYLLRLSNATPAVSTTSTPTR